MQLIGIDCAAQPKNVGFAYAEDRVLMTWGAGWDPVPDIVEAVDWDQPVLIAMDAPLGWPEAMARELARHRPGAPFGVRPNDLFSRRTDRVVRDVVRKRPLDVGADKIARAAHGALAMLDDLRAKVGVELPVLVDPWDGSGTGVIEVYPAATLKARGYPHQGYKGRKPEHRAVRREIVRRIEETVRVPNWDLVLDNDDALDAVVCVLAAIDYIEGRCIEPGVGDEARETEGWIWVRRPELSGANLAGVGAHRSGLHRG